MREKIKLGIIIVMLIIISFFAYWTTFVWDRDILGMVLIVIFFIMLPGFGKYLMHYKGYNDVKNLERDEGWFGGGGY